MDLETLMESPYTEREEQTTKVVREPRTDEILAIVAEYDSSVATDFDLDDAALREHMEDQFGEASSMADAVRLVLGQIAVARTSREKAIDAGRLGITVGWDQKGRQLVEAEIANRPPAEPEPDPEEG